MTVLRGRVEGTTVRAILVIAVVGALLGVAALLCSPPPPLPSDEIPEPAVEQPAFASYFIHFFPGRTPDGSRPRGGSALLRTSKFLAGERVGIRVETVPDLPAPVTVEIRFLSRTTREELPELRDDRQTFRIRRGLRTYCCLRIPREPGEYVIGILVNDQFLAFLPASVNAGPRPGEGGLFVPTEE